MLGIKMALFSRDTGFLIIMVVLAVITNAIPFYLLLNYGKP
jgi:hypothetical protein